MARSQQKNTLEQPGHAALLALVGFTALFISACTSSRFERAEVATQAKAQMIGMSKEQVLACMGAPSQHAAVGQTEVWSYPSGGDTTTFSTANGSIDAAGNASAFETSHSAHRYCVVNVVITAGKVSAVNYNGRTGGWASQGEQCAFAVQNCVQQ
jgi:outer membrane protein assembly factor BamE (lipoprotein component of BamABCDE complex)